MRNFIKKDEITVLGVYSISLNCILKSKIADEDTIAHLSFKRKSGDSMSDRNNEFTFRLCSYLLSYPSQQFLDSIIDIEEELLSLTAPVNIKNELAQFCKKAKKIGLNELIHIFIQTFDFGKKTNLYVTYMSNGEQRERGLELLFLKNYYQFHGFEMTEKELPDYLPVMLEFASQVSEEVMKPLFERYLSNIKEIIDHLDPEQNLYGHILKAVWLALENAGVTKPLQRSEA
ncbi:nitrate reductase molybdenum cofactor assembly chaperone [Calidifontibacillus erzurumensis]|uniref:Nitrate reductase molybdenum cofactor assembly chaperone n=1 Tax=Calidifontibacillus erzurumensis TaxID=2741433 RepID=A0A8J8KC55_9BACI|nr:nitrate reductase molybdenum cofactor assembly chaperone [Calidifontibacillus erzurumensis]NSL52689.1 nitrate reductase molybdenum cofactor assembly chaperone [Calidifontibacillus erzurumensis]